MQSKKIEEWIKETKELKFEDHLEFKYFLWDRVKIALKIIEHLMEALEEFYGNKVNWKAGYVYKGSIPGSLDAQEAIAKAEEELT